MGCILWVYLLIVVFIVGVLYCRVQRPIMITILGVQNIFIICQPHWKKNVWAVPRKLQRAWAWVPKWLPGSLRAWGCARSSDWCGAGGPWDDAYSHSWRVVASPADCGTEPPSPPHCTAALSRVNNHQHPSHKSSDRETFLSYGKPSDISPISQLSFESSKVLG